MAVLSVELTNMEGAEALDGEVTYQSEYQVRCSSINDDSKIVLAAAGLPARGATYALGSSTDTRVQARRRQAKLITRGAHEFVWNVHVEYSNKALAGEPNEDGKGGDPNNPLNNPVRYSGSFVTLQLGLFKDLDGKNFQNSAGDPFEPAIEGTAYHPVLVAERNESTMGFGQAMQYVNKVNSDSFKGAGPRTILCRQISFTPQSYTNSSGTPVTYYSYRYEFEFNEDGWIPLELADMGFSELKNGKKTPIMRQGMEVNTMQFLKPNGQAAGQNEPPNFLKFRVYRETSFSGLGL